MEIIVAALMCWCLVLMSFFIVSWLVYTYQEIMALKMRAKQKAEALAWKWKWYKANEGRRRWRDI